MIKIFNCGVVLHSRHSQGLVLALKRILQTKAILGSRFCLEYLGYSVMRITGS